MSLEDYEEVNELKVMAAYRILKEMLLAIGSEDIPSYQEFCKIYEEELAAQETKH